MHGFRQSVRLGPVSSPPANRPHGAAIHGCARPVDLVASAEFVEHHVVRFIPHAVLQPVAEATPTVHTTPAAHLLRQVFPRNACLQHEQNPRKNGTVINGRSASLFPRRLALGRQRFNPRPEFVRYKWLGYHNLLSSVGGDTQMNRKGGTKCESHVAGTNRRSVVTNRPGARVIPQGAYDDDADRGESENCNKELKRELQSGRLSDHRFLANFFRLMMLTLAYNLLVRLRRPTFQRTAGRSRP